MYIIQKVRSYIVNFQNYPVLLADNRKQSSKEGCVTKGTHSYITNYKNCLQKYDKVCCQTNSITREVFRAVNQGAFLAEAKTVQCKRSKYAFVRCGVANVRVFVYLRRVPSGNLQACHPGLKRSILL